MNGRRNRRKRSFKRVMVTVLTFAMLLSVCFPGMMASADEVVTEPTESQAAAEVTVFDTLMKKIEEAKANTALTADDLALLGQEISTAYQAGEIDAAQYEALTLAYNELTVAPVDNEGGEDVNYSDSSEESSSESVDESSSESAEETTTAPSETSKPEETTTAPSESEETSEPSETTEAPTDPSESSEATEAAQDPAVTALFNQMMSFTDAESYWAFVNSMTDEQNALYDQFTDEQFEALWAHIDTITNDSQSTLETKDISYYVGGILVYWDETDGSGSTDKTEDEDNIKSITLGGNSIQKGDSDLGSGWGGSPSTVATYYPTASTSNNVTATLAITPEDGYYVTRVTIACCPATVAPYNCSTWKAGNAFDQEVNIKAGGTIELSIPTVAFCHDNNNKETSNGSNPSNHQYFILVQTAPLPSPLYVEYDYGKIDTYLSNAGVSISDTVFNKPDTWTSVGNVNDYYGDSTDVRKNTNYTQYEYKYSDDNEEDAAKWTHTSNYITSEADAAAASVGYYFVGWEAQYYEKCDATAITNPTYNNYTYAFSTTYGNSVTYTEGVDVSMITNVRLVAQWAPVTLTVTKTVDGLTSYAGSYDVKLQKNGADADKTNTFSVTGSGTSTAWTISPVTPGTYTIVETSPSVGSVVNDNGTNKYLISTTYSDAVVVTAEAIASGTYRTGNLNVTNTYSDATPNLKIVKDWQDSNGNALTGADTANMPAVTFTISCETHSYTKNVTLSYDASDANYGWVKTYTAAELELPTGCSIGELVVTETVPTGYKQVSNVKTSEEDTSAKIIYSVHTITNKQDTTSITLDKNVTGNMGDWNKEFTFTVYVNDVELESTYNLTHQTPVVTIPNIPIGATVMIVESNNEGYTVTATVDGNNAVVTDNAIEFEVTSADGHSVVFTNDLNAAIDTGITTNTFPMILLFSTVTVLGAVLLIGKKRYEF